MIKNHKADFLALCTNHNVKSLYSVGLSTTNNINFIKSDINLIIEINETDPVAKGETIMS